VLLHCGTRTADVPSMSFPSPSLSHFPLLLLCVTQFYSVAEVDDRCLEGRAPVERVELLVMILPDCLPLLAAPVTFWFGFVAIVTRPGGQSTPARAP
jgi:hypothetical protein